MASTQTPRPQNGRTGGASAPARRRNTGTFILFGLAMLLLVVAAVSSAQAALTYFSEQYDAQISQLDIGITLTENGEAVSTRDYTGSDNEWEGANGVLLQKMLPEGEKLKLGTAYKEELAVQNSGNIDEYVRVKVYKYWLDANGNKMTTLHPDLIGLEWANVGTSWVEDELQSTAERTILYYTKILPVGQSTDLFASTLTIDPSIASKVSQTKETNDEGYTTITTTYDYNGVKFVIEAEADAVQTHNAQDAIKSAWGVTVNIAEDGSLSLDNGAEG